MRFDYLCAGDPKLTLSNVGPQSSASSTYSSHARRRDATTEKKGVGARAWVAHQLKPGAERPFSRLQGTNSLRDNEPQLLSTSTPRWRWQWVPMRRHPCTGRLNHLEQPQLPLPMHTLSPPRRPIILRGQAPSSRRACIAKIPPALCSMTRQCSNETRSIDFWVRESCTDPALRWEAAQAPEADMLALLRLGADLQEQAERRRRQPLQQRAVPRGKATGSQHSVRPADSCFS